MQPLFSPIVDPATTAVCKVSRVSRSRDASLVDLVGTETDIEVFASSRALNYPHGALAFPLSTSRVGHSNPAAQSATHHFSSLNPRLGDAMQTRRTKTLQEPQGVSRKRQSLALIGDGVSVA
jgi:hypothetical protein